MDTAAGQALIGQAALQDLEAALASRGLQPVRAKGGTLPVSRGVGGTSKPVAAIMVPTNIGGAKGFAEFLVPDEPVPPLLPVGLLEMLNARVDLKTGKMEVDWNGQRGDVEMARLPSGHRAISFLPEGQADLGEPPGDMDRAQFLRNYKSPPTIINIPQNLTNNSTCHPESQVALVGQVDLVGPRDGLVSLNTINGSYYRSVGSTRRSKTPPKSALKKNHHSPSNKRVTFGSRGGRRGSRLAVA